MLLFIVASLLLFARSGHWNRPNAREEPTNGERKRRRASALRIFSSLSFCHLLDRMRSSSLDFSIPRSALDRLCLHQSTANRRKTKFLNFSLRNRKTSLCSRDYLQCETLSIEDPNQEIKFPILLFSFYSLKLFRSERSRFTFAQSHSNGLRT